MKCGLLLEIKNNKQWVWLAIDSTTRQIVGVFIGHRSQQGAQGLWNSLPLTYRQSAVYYTDFWEAYKAIIPAHRHYPVGKETGRTNKIENFNCLLRQRISRLVKKHFLFLKRLKIISEQSGILFITIILLFVISDTQYYCLKSLVFQDYRKRKGEPRLATG